LCAAGELGERRGGREAQEVFGGFGATCFFGDLYNTTCTVFDIHGSANRQTDLVEILEIEGKRGHRFVFQGR
jgi:hypothetical protein